MAPPKTVAEYLALATKEQRAALENVRKVIKAAAPDATEEISYGIVGYRYLGKPLLYWGHAKGHVALYGSELGTLRFTPDKPLAASRVKALVRARIEEIESKVASRAKKTSRGTAGRKLGAKTARKPGSKSPRPKTSSRSRARKAAPAKKS